MIDWGAALTVALSGIISVFAVLILLQIAVQGSGAIIKSMEQKNQEKSKVSTN